MPRGPRFCEVCNATNDIEIHHVWPISSGGADMPLNMVALCQDCHHLAHQMDGAKTRESLLAALKSHDLAKQTIPAAGLALEPEGVVERRALLSKLVGLAVMDDEACAATLDLMRLLGGGKFARQLKPLGRKDDPLVSVRGFNAVMSTWSRDGLMHGGIKRPDGAAEQVERMADGDA